MLDRNQYAVVLRHGFEEPNDPMQNTRWWLLDTSEPSLTCLVLASSRTWRTVPIVYHIVGDGGQCRFVVLNIVAGTASESTLIDRRCEKPPAKPLDTKQLKVHAFVAVLFPSISLAVTTSSQLLAHCRSLSLRLSDLDCAPDLTVGHTSQHDPSLSLTSPAQTVDSLVLHHGHVKHKVL
jgi:hypothetical protein